MPRHIIYQLLPRYWGNVSGKNIKSGSLSENACGHFSDIDNNSLDYLKWLGCDCVWLTGVLRHSNGKDFVKGNAGSPYSISDYYDVNAYLSDEADKRIEEFSHCISRIHAHDLKALIDFIPNHVAPDYSDHNGGIPCHDWCDYDWTDTKKINYDAPGCWEAMYSIVHHWASFGVDGVRCDMVELVPPDFFKWLISRIKADFPDFMFVAEIYNKAHYWSYVREIGFDLLYDKSGLYDTLWSIVHGTTGAENITENWQSLGDLQDNMLNFLENHDEKRFASPTFGGNARKCMAPLAVSLLFNDASFMIYQGEEVGENGMEDAGFSSPDGRSTIYDWWSLEKLKTLYEIIQTGLYKNLSINELTQSSLSVREAEFFCRFASTCRLAAFEEAFAEGLNWDLNYCNGYDKSKLFSFLRYSSDKSFLVAANFSDEAIPTRIYVPQKDNSYFVKVPAHEYVVKEI